MPCEPALDDAKGCDIERCTGRRCGCAEVPSVGLWHGPTEQFLLLHDGCPVEPAGIRERTHCWRDTSRCGRGGVPRRIWE